MPLGEEKKFFELGRGVGGGMRSTPATVPGAILGKKTYLAEPSYVGRHSSRRGFASEVRILARFASNEKTPGPIS